MIGSFKMGFPRRAQEQRPKIGMELKEERYGGTFTEAAGICTDDR